MAKKIIKEVITITELIEDEQGNKFIVDRNRTQKIHETRINEKENHSNRQKWEELHRKHVEDINREMLPNMVQQAEAGEQYILKNIVEVHQADEAKAGDFGVQNVWWDALLNWMKNQAISYIIGALRGLVKDQIPNMVKLASWLVEQLENLLVDQFIKITDEETRGIITNELNQYKQLQPLAEKLIEAYKSKK